MTKSLGEAQAHAVVCLEELVCEVLGKEGKHEVAALRAWSEGASAEQRLHQDLWIWELCFTWGSVCVWGGAWAS